MAVIASGSFSSSASLLLLLFCSQVFILTSAIREEKSKVDFAPKIGNQTSQMDTQGYVHGKNCQHCCDKKVSSSSCGYSSADIIVCQHCSDKKVDEGSNLQPVSGLKGDHLPSTDQLLHTGATDPSMLKGMHLQQVVTELSDTSENVELEMQKEGIERSKKLESPMGEKFKYSIWRREYQKKHQPDSTLKLIKDQIVLAQIFASIALSDGNNNLSDLLMRQIKNSQTTIREAISDAELQPGAIEQVKSMGEALAVAREQLYNCNIVAKKLRAMVQSSEENIYALKKKNMFLMQFALSAIPKPLYCLDLQLTTDYYLNGFHQKELSDKVKVEDPSLYHFAIFSDNVLSTAVAVNSTAVTAKEPEKYVFHIVTDKLNFAAMKMWFMAHPPSHATVHVQNIDEFKWLNSSYSPVLYQLESIHSTWDAHTKYRNPKYYSMLNHLRFYMPELFPKLDKILFLDNDVVVQKDLTPLWSIDLRGMVNGAVETCKESLHLFGSYFNFSNPTDDMDFNKVSCMWDFGMNIFDLKEWKRAGLTRKYHIWLDETKDIGRSMIGTLPPGFIVFKGLTYALDKSWHVMDLGYNPFLNLTEIEEAAVIHFNGNYKPWLDLAITKYKKYWTKFLNFDDPYLRLCHFN